MTQINKESEVAFCGIKCSECIKRKGETKKKAEDILKDIKKSGLDDWQDNEPKPEQFNYNDLKKGLKWLASMKCDGCHAGGGNPNCIIRKCAIEKGVNNCGECPEMPCDIIRKFKEETGIDVEKNFKNIHK